MTTNYVIIDKVQGATDFSLGTMNDALKKLSVVYSQDHPVKIYELRDYSQKDTTGIGFFLKSPVIEGIISHSFWVPGRKNFSELADSDGGVGLNGYKKAVSLIYRYLNQQPRIVVEAGYKKMKDILSDPYSAAEMIGGFDIKEVVEEDETIIPHLIRNLYPEHDFSFIAFDIETPDYKTREYILGCSWDMFHGLRPWDESEGGDLIEECNRFDKVVTYHGDNFDLNVMSKISPDEVKRIREGKSVDLYKVIRNCCVKQKSYRRRGETNLANVGFTTLGLCKWEVYHQPDMENRREPIDDYIIDHCARDAEMTKELFFYMLEHPQVYYVSRAAMEDGRMVDSIRTQEEFLKTLKNVAVPEKEVYKAHFSGDAF